MCSVPGLGRFPWRRAQQLTPVFLPRGSRGQRRLVGYSPLGHNEPDTTEATLHAYTYIHIHMCEVVIVIHLQGIRYTAKFFTTHSLINMPLNIKI